MGNYRAQIYGFLLPADSENYGFAYMCSIAQEVNQHNILNNKNTEPI